MLNIKKLIEMKGQYPDEQQDKIDFIDKIINEIQNIKYYEKIEENDDMQYHCMYFGNTVLFLTDDFDKYTDDEQIDIVLNHIFHYMGNLYLITSSKLRKRYIEECFTICFGTSEGHIIFDISENYKKFLKRNVDLIPLFKKDNFGFTVNHTSVGEKVQTNTIFLTNNFKIV